MFVSDRYVFLELQKTGTTHIRALLKERGVVLEDLPTGVRWKTA